ncbi:VanW family protein [Pseudomonas sp. MDT1-16]
MDCQAITLGEHLLDVVYNLALQHNKVINLKLVVASIDGVIIGPQEYFSFCRLVGRTTCQRGYVDNVAQQQLEGELLCDQMREFRYHGYQRVSGFISFGCWLSTRLMRRYLKCWLKYKKTGDLKIARFFVF